MLRNRSTNPLHTSEGDFATVTPGTERTQGTTKIYVATANPMDGHTRATKIDICDALANNCKHIPLYTRGFVSPPTTATAKHHDEQEQHIQVATGDCAGIPDCRLRFPGLRPHPPQQRGTGHGARRAKATHCSEHDAHNDVATDEWPAIPLSLTTNTPTTNVDNNIALAVQAGEQQA